MKKTFMIALMFLVIGTFGCSTPVVEENDSKLIEIVKTMEQNEHQLINFEITYDQYKENTDKFLFSNFKNMENQVLFALKGKEFKGKDLAGVSQNEMVQFKEKVENALNDSFGKPQYDVVHISDVYSDDKKEWKYIFTKQRVEFEKSRDIVKHKKYMFIKIKDSWVIMSIDKNTDRNQNTENNGQDIKYNYTYQVES